MAQKPLVGQGFLITDASRSHSDAPHSVGLLLKSDKPPPDRTQNSQEISVPPTGFEPTIPASKQPQITPQTSRPLRSAMNVYRHQ